jgi:hypothetical protein
MITKSIAAATTRASRRTIGRCNGSDSGRDINALERSIEFMSIRPKLVAVASVALAVACTVVVALLAASTLRAQSGSELDVVVERATETHRFSIITYELTHLPNRWLSNVAAWLDQPELDEELILGRWFEHGETRDRKAAEILLERRLAQAVSELQLDTPLPMFGRVRVVWPPVDIDLSERLHVLAVSPRNEIRMVRSELLTSEVKRDDYEQIEATIESGGRWSAWIGRVGGVALYPASVVSSRDFLGTLQIMAHEWTHHYLGFYPLGLAYARGSEMRTINETVADIVGDQLGEFAAALPGYEPTRPAEPDAERETIRSATDPILRQLRLDVDTLLAAGKIEEAERGMEAARLRLIDLGRPFRRINQAFLAFRGGYGASPASTSPWGDRLIEFRSAQESLSEFLKTVRTIGSPDEADRLLPR